MDYDLNKFKTGDLVMSRPVGKNENWFSNGIMYIMDCNHSHDEMMLREPDGLYVGNAHAPHYELTPFEERLIEFEDGERVCAVFRWHTFTEKPINHGMYFEAFQDSAGASIRTLAYSKNPYDKKSIRRIGMIAVVENIFRKKMKFKNVEHFVYCTEGCVLVYRVCRINIMQSLGPQEYSAPVHMERLWVAGKWVLLEDFGLLKYLQAATR